MSVTKRFWENKGGKLSFAWQVYVCYGTLRIRLQYPSFREADAVHTLIKSEILSGTFSPEFYTRTVRDVVDRMIAAKQEHRDNGEVPPSTLRQLKGIALNYVIGDRSRYQEASKIFYLDRMVPWTEDDGIGDVKLVNVQPHVIKDLLRRLQRRGASFVLRTRVRSTLTVIFQWAIEELGWAKVNPTDQVTVRKTKADYKPKLVVMKEQHLALLCDVAPPLQYLLLQFTALTAVRVGELIALKWENIDTGNNVVFVDATINEAGERVATKSESGMGRPVIISDALAAALDEHRYASDFSDSEDPVFTLNGDHFNHNSLYRTQLKPLLRAAEEQLATHPEKYPEVTKEGFTLKALRHFGISSWIDMDLPEIAVWQMAGHSGPATIHNVYGHLMHGRDKVEQMNSISTRFFGSKQPTVDQPS